MIFDRDKNQVIVKGMANWFTLWLALYFILSSLNLLKTLLIEIAGPVAFVVLVLVVTYWMQSWVFSRVGNFAAELCSKEHFLNRGGV
jgi:putative flippase GtrA